MNSVVNLPLFPERKLFSGGFNEFFWNSFNRYIATPFKTEICFLGFFLDLNFIEKERVFNLDEKTWQYTQTDN